jgi:hypothetical protein
MASRDKRPLIAYLRVQEFWEAELLKILKRASAENAKLIRELAGKKGIGAQVRRDQLLLVKRELLKAQADLWKTVGSTVEAGRADAAAAAVRSNFVYEDVLIRSGISKVVRARLLASAEKQAQKGLDNVVARMTGLSNYTLSKQVYNTRQLSNGVIQRLIERQIANGVSWSELAKAVRGYIDPNVRGGVSYAAKRLARTELNNAFHAVSVKQGIESPFIIGQTWNLSSSHPRPDACNDYADSSHFEGGEAGQYREADVPSKPHPNCLCYLTPITPSRDEFIKKYLAGGYDSYLDGVIGK